MVGIIYYCALRLAGLQVLDDVNKCDDLSIILCWKLFHLETFVLYWVQRLNEKA